MRCWKLAWMLSARPARPGPALSLLLLGPLVYGHHTYCARSAASSSTKYHCLFSVCAVCIHNNLSQDYYHFTFHIYAGSLDRLAKHYCYWMNVYCVYSTLHLYRCVKIWCTAHVLVRLCPMSVWDFLDEVPYIAERERPSCASRTHVLFSFQKRNGYSSYSTNNLHSTIHLLLLLFSSSARKWNESKCSYYFDYIMM